MLYTLFSTTASPYMNWQSELLEYSWQEVGQYGELVRLIATDDPQTAPQHTRMPTVITRPWGIHPQTGDNYPIYNKPASLLEWLTTENPHGTVLLIDPDCVFRAPVKREVLPGAPVSQDWIDYYPQATYHSPHAGPPFELIRRYCPKNWELVKGVMIPTLIHTDDLKRIASRWLEMTSVIRQEVRNAHGDPLWESDMYAYLIVAAEAGLVHQQASLGICTNWSPERVVNTPLIHYCQPILSPDGQELWAKGTYRPWQRSRDPQRAQHDYGRDLLYMLNRFIQHREAHRDASPRHDRKSAMKTPEKTKEQLISELIGLRQQVAPAGAKTCTSTGGSGAPCAPRGSD